MEGSQPDFVANPPGTDPIIKRIAQHRAQIIAEIHALNPRRLESEPETETETEVQVPPDSSLSSSTMDFANSQVQPAEDRTSGNGKEGEGGEEPAVGIRPTYLPSPTTPGNAMYGNHLRTIDEPRFRVSRFGSDSIEFKYHLREYILETASEYSSSHRAAVELEVESREQDGLFMHFILRPESQLHDPQAAVSGCTVNIRIAAVNDGSGCRTGGVAVISNLWTKSEMRMEGVGKKLLHGVTRWIDRLGNIECSLFFSSSPLITFSSDGWIPQRVQQLRIRLFEEDPPSLTADLCSEPACSPEREGVRGSHTKKNKRNIRFCTSMKAMPLPLGMAVVCCGSQDCEKIMRRLSGTRRDRRTHVQIIPETKNVFMSLLRATMLNTKVDRQGRKMPWCHGVKIRPQRYGGPQSWAVWAHDLAGKKLNIIRLGCDRPSGLQDQMRTILVAAIHEAIDQDLREVVLWDPSQDVLSAAFGIADDPHAGWVVGVHKEDVVTGAPYIRWPHGLDIDGVWYGRQMYTWL